MTTESEALERRAERACRLAFRTAIAALGDVDDARDVAQDVTVEVLRGVASLREPKSFDAWVHRISVRQTMRAARARQRRRRREQPIEPLLDGDGDALAQRDVVSEAVLRGADLERLLKALEGVSARERVALALRYVHDLSEREIAATLRCRPGTAASLLSRGRSKLRAAGVLDADAADKEHGDASNGARPPQRAVRADPSART